MGGKSTIGTCGKVGDGMRSTKTKSKAVKRVFVIGDGVRDRDTMVQNIYI